MESKSKPIDQVTSLTTVSMGSKRSLRNDFDTESNLYLDSMKSTIFDQGLITL